MLHIITKIAGKQYSVENVREVEAKMKFWVLKQD